MPFTTVHRSRRSLPNWQGVMRDLRAGRHARLTYLRSDGTYDLSLIMREAVRHARRYRHLPSWRRRMAVALCIVWERAKAERLASGHSPQSATRTHPASTPTGAKGRTRAQPPAD